MLGCHFDREHASTMEENFMMIDVSATKTMLEVSIMTLAILGVAK